MKKEVTINNLSDLTGAAKELLNIDSDSKIFAFFGEMGAGKTTFIKAICKELDVKDEVSSPTFAIINEYLANNSEPVYHFDFYRIKDEREALDIGLEEYLYSENYCFIEWPEKILNLLPENFIKVNITVEGEKRLISLK
ncbi:MAG: tRNA (adenosine(37)-N6)-threonylcarbamoyltransferase complex ATPase subunit type 1 TsaE [Flavobacteriales bacterium]|nr:MAG: tRNA (adenosine(37)-N6)-threonylcarbamoyltransferase complex ATPase subunit type 1 TsaE [Flavobacteriales bacterium]